MSDRLAYGSKLTGGGVGHIYTDGDGINISAQDEISVDTTFTEASTRANIASGESFATILGKIKKWFTDLPNMFVSKSGDTMSGNLTVDRQNGTAGTDGFSQVWVGNNIPSGTPGNSYGEIELYGKGSKFINIHPGTPSDNRTVVFQDKSGFVALTDDIPTDFVSKANGGTFDNNISVVKKNAGTGSVPSRVTVGNSTPDGTVGASHGNLLIYDRGSRYAEIRTPNNLTAIRHINLPDADGTIALTSDIETKTVKSSTTPTYNTQIASELSSGSTDNLTLYTLSNGMRVMNGLFLVVASEVTPSDKLFDIPSDYTWHNEGYSGQYWLSVTNVLTKETYTIRIHEAAYPWGVNMPYGTYLLHEVF